MLRSLLGTSTVSSARYLAASREAGHHGVFFVVGLLWGGLTGFALASPYPQGVQAAGLAGAAGVVLLGTREGWKHLRQSLNGQLLAAYAVVAVVSGLVHHAAASAVLRYGAVFVAYLVMMQVAAAGSRPRDAFFQGLIGASLVFVVFHLFKVHWDNLFDPTDRVWVFLNPNGVGFIAAMTAVGLLGGVAAGTFRGAGRYLALAGVAGSTALCVVSMTRASVVVLLGGALAVGVLWLIGQKKAGPVWKPLAWLGLPVALWILLEGLGVGMLDGLRAALRLQDAPAVLATGADRFVAWRYIVHDLWPQHYLLGAGPGHQEALVAQHTGIAGAHNGMLMNLADLGLLGVLPLLAVLLLSLRHIARAAGQAGVSILAAGLFTAGVLESLVETMFFSVGNPASLLFMFSLAVLERNRLA